MKPIETEEKNISKVIKSRIIIIYYIKLSNGTSNGHKDNVSKLNTPSSPVEDDSKHS